MRRGVDFCEILAKNDIPKVVRNIRNTIIKCYPKIYAPEVVSFFLDYHSEERICGRYNEGGHFIIIKDSLDEVKACGYLLKNEIGGLYVSPTNQRKGHGKKIVGGLLDIAKNENIDHVWVDATLLAKEFYLSIGFKLIEKMTDYVEVNIPLAYYRMEKSVS